MSVQDQPVCANCARPLPRSCQPVAVVDRCTGEPGELLLCRSCAEKPGAIWRRRFKPRGEVELSEWELEPEWEPRRRLDPRQKGRR